MARHIHININCGGNIMEALDQLNAKIDEMDEAAVKEREEAVAFVKLLKESLQALRDEVQRLNDLLAAGTLTPEQVTAIKDRLDAVKAKIEGVVTDEDKA